jgi:hypothetical protein
MNSMPIGLRPNSRRLRRFGSAGGGAGVVGAMATVLMIGPPYFFTMV